MKTCSGCKISKPLSNFGRHTRRKDGLRSRCRSCEAKPPRTATCAACGEAFQFKQRGPAAHICEPCSAEWHWCHSCKTAKPKAEFYNQSTAARKIAYRCKPCGLAYATSDAGVRQRKATAVRLRYGITLDEYEAHFARARGRCECCGKKRRLVLDHCHATGRIRGAICSACNTGIGNLGDTAEGLQRALVYLNNAM